MQPQSTGAVTCGVMSPRKVSLPTAITITAAHVDFYDTCNPSDQRPNEAGEAQSIKPYARLSRIKLLKEEHCMLCYWHLLFASSFTSCKAYSTCNPGLTFPAVITISAAHADFYDICNPPDQRPDEADESLFLGPYARFGGVMPLKEERCM